MTGTIRIVLSLDFDQRRKDTKDIFYKDIVIEVCDFKLSISK